MKRPPADPLYRTLRFTDGLVLDGPTLDTCPVGNMARPHWRRGLDRPVCRHHDSELTMGLT